MVCFALNDDNVGFDLYELATDILYFCLYFCVNPHNLPSFDFFREIELFLMSGCVELIHELAISCLVESSFVEIDNLVDMVILLFEFLMVAATLQRISG